MLPICPPNLLTEAELSALEPGDLVQRYDGDWFRVVRVYEATTSACGVRTVPFYARTLDDLGGWSDCLIGPSEVADKPGQWNGTPHERVRFRPAPAPAPPALPTVPAAILAKLPLSVTLPAGLLADLPSDWEREAASSRRLAQASPYSKQAWEFHASAYEQAAQRLRHVLALAEAGR